MYILLAPFSKHNPDDKWQVVDETTVEDGKYKVVAETDTHERAVKIRKALNGEG